MLCHSRAYCLEVAHLLDKAFGRQLIHGRNSHVGTLGRYTQTSILFATIEHSGDDRCDDLRNM